ncbi:MAG: hypothetical protein ACI9ES_002303 [Oceanospirillaceae bacterium]|jgi:hypothetical protein
MGCDIHMFCEEQVTISGKTEWRSADHFKRNHYFGIDEDEGEKELEVVELCGSRNYSMFTALCGVRDYTDKSPKISAPKGLPDDVTDFVRKESDDIYSDGHSRSYVTLAEVKAFVDKNDPVKFSGLLNPSAVKDFDENGVLPTSWCQGTNQADYEFREWEDNTYSPLKTLFELMAKRFRPYWNVDDLMPEDMEKFRIVFWFDN